MLRIHSKVNTTYGEGILVSVKTDFNGFCEYSIIYYILPVLKIMR